MTRFLIVAALSLAACGAEAEPLRLAQATTSAPPAVGEPAPKPAPAKKTQKAKPKDKDGQATATPPRSDSGYKTINTGQRRITRDDLEDDPSAPAGSNLRPVLTPEGRAGLGGRFLERQ